MTADQRKESLDILHRFWCDMEFDMQLLQEAITFHHHGRLIEALQVLNQAALESPENPWIYYNRGIVHGDLGSDEDALADFSRAIVLDAEFGPAYTNRGIILRVRGDLAGALRDADKAIELHAISGRYLGQTTSLAKKLCNRAMVKRDLGELESALEDIDAGLRQEDATPILKYEKALILDAMGMKREASNCFKQFLKTADRKEFKEMIAYSRNRLGRMGRG